MEIVLSRFQEVFFEVAATSTKCVLISTDWTPNDDSDFIEIHQSVITRGVFWRTVEQEGFFVWKLFQQECQVGESDFELLVRRVAMNEIVNLLIVDWDGSWIICPYDGGIDIIAKDSLERDRLARMFSKWRSPHPSGL